MLRAVADAFNRVAENEAMRGLILSGEECKC